MLDSVASNLATNYISHSVIVIESGSFQIAHFEICPHYTPPTTASTRARLCEKIKREREEQEEEEEGRRFDGSTSIVMAERKPLMDKKAAGGEASAPGKDAKVSRARDTTSGAGDDGKSTHKSPKKRRKVNHGTFLPGLRSYPDSLRETRRGRGWIASRGRRECFS